MKRITYWPQAWLGESLTTIYRWLIKYGGKGLAVNWGVIVAYAADTGKVDCTAILLLLGAIWYIFWNTGSLWLT